MEFRLRTRAITATLLAGFLLIILYLIGSRWENKVVIRNSSNSYTPHTNLLQWPKRTRPSSGITGRYNHNRKNITIKTLSLDHLDSVNSTTKRDNKNFVIPFLNSSTKSKELCPSIPPNLDGLITVDKTYETLSAVETKLAPKLMAGGYFAPNECKARDRVAIVVPYRDREQHLPIFLRNLHLFLMKQQIEYTIYIVEQSSDGQFNRAMLMNIGFVVALRISNWNCFIFHDGDLLPMDDRNLYTCPDQPRHMSVAVDKLGFKLPYSTIFGGVSAMTVQQFKKVNGYSNSYWGWGGEDDDMSNRLKSAGFHIARYPVNITRYTMLDHKKEKANTKRYQILGTGSKRINFDGLNSLEYTRLIIKKMPLYTLINVRITYNLR